MYKLFLQQVQSATKRTFRNCLLDCVFPLAEFQAFSFKQDYSYFNVALSCCKIEKKIWLLVLWRKVGHGNWFFLFCKSDSHNMTSWVELFNIFNHSYTSPLLHLTTIFNIVFFFVIQIVESLRRFCHSNRDKNDQTAACMPYCTYFWLCCLFYLTQQTTSLLSE